MANEPACPAFFCNDMTAPTLKDIPHNGMVYGVKDGEQMRYFKNQDGEVKELKEAGLDRCQINGIVFKLQLPG